MTSNSIISIENYFTKFIFTRKPSVFMYIYLFIYYLQFFVQFVLLVLIPKSTLWESPYLWHYFLNHLYFLFKECLPGFRIHLPFHILFYYFWCQKVLFRKDHLVNSLICGTIISTFCTNYVGISKNFLPSLLVL